MRTPFFILFFLTASVGRSQVAHLFPGGNEPSIAVHPQRPNDIVVATNVDRFYHSTDGGRNWNAINATSQYGFYGDPVLRYLDGHLYFAHLSKTSGKAYGDWFDRIVVQRIDQVDRWEQKSFSVGFNNGKMQDKPWLSGDARAASPYRGNVYVSWTEFDRYGSADPKDRSRIRFARLKTGDTAFSEAVTVSDSTGDCQDGDHTLEGAVSAVGPDGTVYLVWAGHSKIWFDRSLDGGTNWGIDRVIAEQAGSWDIAIPHLMRTNGMPFLQTDAQGRLFLVFSELYDGIGRVRALVSRDGGVSWEEQAFPAGTGHQYSPNLILATDGPLSVHMDRGRSPAGLFFDVVRTRWVEDSGQWVFEQERVNDRPIPLPGDRVFFGDYIDVAQGAERSLVAYTDLVDMQPRVMVRDQAGIPAEGSPTISLLVNRDSVLLIYHGTGAYRLRGNIYITQLGEGQNASRTERRLKNAFRPDRGDPSEGIIARFAIDPDLPVHIRLDARVCRHWWTRSHRLRHEATYP